MTVSTSSIGSTLRAERDRPPVVADRAEALFAAATSAAPPRVCVVAEIGVNHDGQVTRAVDLADAAADAGADAVKLQCFDPRHLLSNQAALADYQKQDESDVFEMLDRLKLGADDLLQVRAAAQRRGLRFIVTPFSLENVETLASLNVDAVKIASPDAVNLPLLRRVTTLNRPLIISTGTATLDELVPAARIIAAHPSGGCFLQCVSSYPTPTADTALGGMVAIARNFDLPVGYSDHTNEPATGALAVAAGACVIEKHLTYDRTATGPDHAASFDAAQLAEYIRAIRQAAQMHGPADKLVGRTEVELRGLCRQSLCARRDLPAGRVLSEADLTVKRPGTGIPAAQFQHVVGRRLGRDVKGNDLLTLDDVA